MQGNLSQISLTDILLLATGGKKSGLLKLNRGKETVEVYFADGNILHATCPIGDGEKALLYPVTWSEGTFTLVPNGHCPATTIQKSSSEILDEVKVMTREWETILEVIPSGKTVVRIADLSDEHDGPVTVPHVGWRVLSKIDGRRTVQEIAELLRIPYAYTAKVLYNLHKAGLVEIVTAAEKAGVEVVPPVLLNRLSTILTDIIGPMAPFVLEDQIQSLNESSESFPEAKLDELVGLVSREISDMSLRNKFEEQVFQEISNFKKF
ncbi:MAG TPA: DUF4388 domain-containing protein [Candidatus Binatia bacterium]|jgi:hypothetical protein